MHVHSRQHKRVRVSDGINVPVPQPMCDFGLGVGVYGVTEALIVRVWAGLVEFKDP
jgi:hypothetical protein